MADTREQAQDAVEKVLEDMRKTERLTTVVWIAKLRDALFARDAEACTHVKKAVSLAIEEHEAALCPEDFGCAEYIALLQKKVSEGDALVREARLAGKIEAVEQMIEGATVSFEDEFFRDLQNFLAQLKAEGEK